MRLVTASLVGLLVATPLLAQEPVTEERQHVVRQGDTLWELAGHYFSNPFGWRTIYEANTTVVEDPHWIYPQEVLTIPGIAGDTEPGPAPVVRPMDRPVRTVFYRPSPARPQATDEPTVLAEPALTTVAVRPGEFSSAPFLTDPDELQVRGVFLRSIRDDREAPGAALSAHPHDRVYLSYVGAGRPAVGDRFSLVSVGRRVKGAAGGHRIIHPRATVRVVELSGEVMEARIEAQYGPVYPEQLVIPVPVFPEMEGQQAAPVEEGEELAGVILEFVDDQPRYGPTALALINLGRRHGVQEGDVFQAYLPPRAVRDRDPGDFRTRIETLPPEVVAELRVVRVTDRYATVRADEVSLPRLQAKLPVRRIRKMP